MKSLTNFLKENVININEMLKSPNIKLVIKQLNNKFAKTYGTIELLTKDYKKLKYLNNRTIEQIKIPAKFFKHRKELEDYCRVLKYDLTGYNPIDPDDFCVKDDNEIKIYKNEDEDFFVGYLEPQTTVDKTDYVYSDCKGIIYHVTNELNCYKILKKGLKLKANSGNRDFESRVYFTCGTNSSEIIKRINKIFSRKGYTKNQMDNYKEISKSEINGVILTIDLNKIQSKLTCYVDNIKEYKENGAFFTYNSIPANAIIEYKSYKDFKLDIE